MPEQYCKKTSKEHGKKNAKFLKNEVSTMALNPNCTVF